MDISLEDIVQKVLEAAAKECLETISINGTILAKYRSPALCAHAIMSINAGELLKEITASKTPKFFAVSTRKV